MRVNFPAFGRLLVLSLCAACAGCSDSVTVEFPLSKTVADDRPQFMLDSASPFRIEFGRGSGWHGLDTVSIDQAGNVVMHRQTRNGWESTSFRLSRAELDSVLDSLNQNGVYALNREYHSNIADGTQWVFCATQGENVKSVYFNNYFPDAIISFASDLDAQLHVETRAVSWTAVPPVQPRSHEKDLWDSIRVP